MNKQKTNILKSIVLALLLVVVSASCQKEATPDVEAAAAVQKGTDPIAKIAIDNNFTELVSALAYVDKELNAGLVNLFLNGKDQYTVFAPTNKAFQDLYKAQNVSKISDLPAPLVLNVLKYHVTEGRRAANSVVPRNGVRTITTLLPNATFAVSSDLSIQAVGNTSNIVAANISASNGVIHVIDAVLLPIK